MKATTFFAAAVLAVSAITQPALASDQILDNSPSVGAMAVDLVLIRPLSLVGTVLTTGLFILQLPLAIPQGEMPREAAQKLVVEPFKYTFTRPLGVTER